MNQRKQIIFLDFDGVLNKSQIADTTSPAPRFLNDNISALKLILFSQPRARIVITSGWRNIRPFELLVDTLAKYGISKNFVIGSTQSLTGTRGSEIQYWLNTHPHEWTSFVILDDRTDFPGLENFHVRTLPGEGLTEDHALIASEILEGVRSLH